MAREDSIPQKQNNIRIRYEEVINSVKGSLQTGAIVEGALMASLTAVLALMGIYLPFLRVLTDLVWTIPIVLVTVRRGISTGVLSIAAAGFLIFSLAGPVQAVFLVLQFGLLALVYGYSFHKGFKPSLTLMWGVITSVASILLVVFLSFLISGINSLDLAAQMKESIEPTMEIYRKMGLFSTSGSQGLTEEAVRQMLEGVIQLISWMIPGILAVYGLMSAFLNYIIAQKILVKLRITVPQLPPFRYWQLPWWVIWGFILGFGLYLGSSYGRNHTLEIVAMNIMLLYAPVAFVLGLANCSFYLHKHPEKSAFFRVIFVILIVFFSAYTIIMIGGIGMADLLFNYRRLPGES